MPEQLKLTPWVTVKNARVENCLNYIYFASLSMNTETKTFSEELRALIVTVSPECLRGHAIHFFYNNNLVVFIMMLINSMQFVSYLLCFLVLCRKSSRV